MVKSSRNDSTVQRVEIVPVEYKGYTISSDAIGSIAELSIQGKIGGEKSTTLTTILLDSGSDGNLIARATLDRVCPDWESFEDAPGPSFAECAGGKSIRMIGTKWIDLEIGSIRKSLPFSIVDGGEVTILGISGLRHFKINLDFGNSGVRITVDKEDIQSQEAKDLVHFQTNQTKLTLRPKETKVFSLENVNLVEEDEYIVTVHRGPTILVPALAAARGGKLVVVLHNDRNKKVVVKRNKLMFRIERFEHATMIQETEPEEINFKFVKFPASRHATKFNNVFYDTHQDVSGPREGGAESSTLGLEALSEMEGLEIPQMEFPAKTPREVVEESFLTCTPEEKEFLHNQFDIHPTIVSTHSFDIGCLRDHNGDRVEVEVELKKEVPRNIRYYKLDEAMESQLYEILSYLEHYQIIRPAPPHLQFGVPTFLISRGGSTQHPPRLLLDTRGLRDVVATGLATASTDIHKPLQKILKSEYVSIFDIRQAYFSISYHERTLETGLTQIATPFGYYQFLKLSMGNDFSPKVFMDALRKELQLDSQGLYNPLESIEVWYDDLLLHSKCKKSHEVLLAEFFTRIDRMNLKLSLGKSAAFMKVKEDSFKVLGYQIIRGTLYPQEKKVKQLLEFPAPKNRTCVQKYLGLITFLRPCLPSLALHYATELYELTSPTVKFEWKENHERAFQQIKEILNTGLAYVHPFEGGLFLMYADASEQLYGGLGFSYDILNVPGMYDRTLAPHMAHEIDEFSSFHEHMNGHGIKAWRIEDGLPKDQPQHIRVLSLCYIYSKNFDTTTPAPTGKLMADNVLNAVFANTTTLNVLFHGEIDRFIDTIISEGLTEENFMDNASQVLHIIGLAIRVNIKLIIGNGRKGLLPVITIMDKYRSDLVLGWCSIESRFYLFNVVESFEHPKCSLVASKFVELARMPADVILKRFKEDMKAGKSIPTIRLVGLFSRAIPEVDRAAPIHLKEAIAILYSAHHFSTYISSAPLSILLSDSKVMCFLFAPKVGESRKRILNYGLKLSLSYPSLQLLHVSSKENAADVLSRLGLPKAEFFAKGLTPVQVSREFREKLKGKIMNFSALYELCKQHPEAIIFSDKKLDTKEQNRLYLDEGPGLQVNLVKAPLTYPYQRVERYGELMSRHIIAEQQIQEFGPLKGEEHVGLYVVDGKIVLPRTMNAVAIMREHYLSLHCGDRKLVEQVRTFFHVPDVSILKKDIQLLTKSCIGCLLVNSARDMYQHGIYPLHSKNTHIQVDLVERLAGKKAGYLMVVIDTYTKYVTVYPLLTKKMDQIILNLANYFAQNGRIRYLGADNYFRSRALRQFCASQGCVLLESAAYRSRSRAFVESVNHRLQRGMKLLNVNSDLPFEHTLPLATFLLNSIHLHGTNITPTDLHWGMHPNSTLEMRPDLLGLSNSGIRADPGTVEKVLEELKLAQDDFIEHRGKERKALQTKKNMRRGPHSFQVGDVVLIRKRLEVTGVSSKLNDRYLKVPYKVHRSSEYLIFIESLLSGVILPRGPADLKKVKGLHLDDMTLTLTGDRAEFLTLFQLLDGASVVEDLLEMALGPKMARDDGIKTRAQKQIEEVLLTEQQILDLYQQTEDDHVAFE